MNVERTLTILLTNNTELVFKNIIEYYYSLKEYALIIKITGGSRLIHIPDEVIKSYTFRENGVKEDNNA